MPSQPDETPAMDLRNCLQLIANLEPVLYRGIQWAELEWEDMQAIKARIEAALAKLENRPLGMAERRSGYRLGDNGYAERITGLPLHEDWDLIEDA